MLPVRDGSSAPLRLFPFNWIRKAGAKGELSLVGFSVCGDFYLC